MGTVVMEPELRAKSNGGTAVVEVTDEAGNVVGSYVPRGQVSDEEYERVMSILLPPLSREELDEARKEMLEHGGVSTAEIIAAIENGIRRAEARRK